MNAALVLSLVALSENAYRPAQTEPEQCRVEAERRVTPQYAVHDCVLAPGDFVYIVIPHQCTWSYMIGVDGKLPILPVIGGFPAAGLKLSELGPNLSALLSKYFKQETKVTVYLAHDPKLPSYFVFGQVFEPGQYAVGQPVSLIEAINRAGGLRGRRRDYKITVLRGGRRLKFRYGQLVLHPQQDVMLQKGDYILVLE